MFSFRTDWTENSEHIVTMFHYMDWPENSVPKDPLTLFEIIHCLEKMNSQCTLVHCGGGVGRTGTFIALMLLMDQILSKAKYVNVFQTVLDLRNDRKFMVRNAVIVVIFIMMFYEFSLITGE